MTGVGVRRAETGDLDEIWQLVRRAVEHMRALGNDQWGEDYPTRALYAQDIENHELWAVTGADGAVLGVAAITCQHEPSYENIPFCKPEPAVAMHRVAVDPDIQRRGVASALFRQCELEGRRLGVAALRIDTYHLNSRMQALIEKQGYRYVGDTSYRMRPLRYPCYEKVLEEA